LHSHCLGLNHTIEMALLSTCNRTGIYAAGAPVIHFGTGAATLLPGMQTVGDRALGRGAA
jgi:glutamyl-tRNA reductase